MIGTLDSIFRTNLVEFQQLADFLSNFIWTGSIELEANPVAGDSVQTRYVANFDMKSQMAKYNEYLHYLRYGFPKRK